MLESLVFREVTGLCWNLPWRHSINKYINENCTRGVLFKFYIGPGCYWEVMCGVPWCFSLQHRTSYHIFLCTMTINFLGWSKSNFRNKIVKFINQRGDSRFNSSHLLHGMTFRELFTLNPWFISKLTESHDLRFNKQYWEIYKRYCTLAWPTALSPVFPNWTTIPYNVHKK